MPAYLPKIFRQLALLFVLSAFLPVFLPAFLGVFLGAEAPSINYEEARQALLRLWEQDYQAELRPTHIVVNPEKKGILCNRARKEQICYYHFKLTLPRPYRSQKNKQDKRTRQDNMIILKPGQNIEAWLQCRLRASLKELCQWKLYFLRRDLLPGRAKYWYQL